MENFNKFKHLEFKTQYYGNDLTESVNKLNIYIEKLNKCFDDEQENFANICYYVYKLKQLFKDYNRTWYFGFETNNQRYLFDSIMEGFGIDTTQVSRILSVYEKFIELNNEKPKIISDFIGFSKSKLFELLPVDTEQLKLDIKNKVLKSDMSVKTIREYVKNYLTIQKQKKQLNEPREDKQEKIVEEEIPMVYNPTQHYNFDYFEEKNKAQLLNIVWDLQKEYEKLKEKYNKLKKGR